MLYAVLQVWGGTFYFLNKVFLSRAERAKNDETERIWRIWCWTVYLIGLPGYFLVFLLQDNFIAAGAEIGGGPAMALGFVLALWGHRKKPAWVDVLDIFSIAVAAAAGMVYSVHLIGGITTFNQVLEFFMVAGFLAGTVLLAKKNPKGYLWFLLMNGTNAVLQSREEAYFLVVLQIVSMGLVLDAYLVQRRKARARHASINSPVS
ncbi:MAG: nicotinamide mononucleotide transporter [Candidatus Jorgensenbacteria bacterium]